MDIAVHVQLLGKLDFQGISLQSFFSFFVRFLNLVCHKILKSSALTIQNYRMLRKKSNPLKHTHCLCQGVYSFIDTFYVDKILSFSDNKSWYFSRNLSTCLQVGKFLYHWHCPWYPPILTKWPLRMHRLLISIQYSIESLLFFHAEFGKFWMWKIC